MTPRDAHRHKEKLLASISRYSRAGGGIGTALVPNLRDRFIRSAFVKASTLQRLRPMQPHSVEEIVAIAGAIDLNAPCTEEIPWLLRARKTGGYRAVVDLPLRVRIAHEMAKDLLVSQVQPGPHIFNWKGDVTP